MLLNTQSPINVLVLCTGNSARSVIAEALLNHLLPSRVRAFSAGSQPTGKINPMAAELLGCLGIQGQWRSKSWDEFCRPGATPIDLVLTVCGNADQRCPVFPGNPSRLHWGLPDPAAVADPAERRQAFADCHQELHARISTLAEQDWQGASQLAEHMRALTPA